MPTTESVLTLSRESPAAILQPVQTTLAAFAASPCLETAVEFCLSVRVAWDKLYAAWDVGRRDKQVITAFAESIRTGVTHLRALGQTTSDETTAALCRDYEKNCEFRRKLVGLLIESGSEAVNMAIDKFVAAKGYRG